MVPCAPRVCLRPDQDLPVLAGRGEVGLADADGGGPGDVPDPVRVAGQDVLDGIGRPLLALLAVRANKGEA